MIPTMLNTEGTKNYVPSLPQPYDLGNYTLHIMLISLHEMKRLIVDMINNNWLSIVRCQAAQNYQIINLYKLHVCLDD